MDPFVDETLGDISTPVPTPVSSVHEVVIEPEHDTIQNIINDEDSQSESRYQPIMQVKFLRLFYRMSNYDPL